jgi:hypothetical protein
VKIKYGRYTHADQEATISIAKRKEISETGFAVARIESWTISGQLQADSVAALTTAIRALEAAYEDDNQDIGLYTAGGVATAHVIRRRDADYIRVLGPPQYPDGSGGQYVTYRDYQVSLEIRIPLTRAGANDDLESWSESVEIVGDGGPITKFAPVVDGLWDKQITNTRSIVTITQSGTAKGRSGYPIPPAPLIPSALVRPGGLKKSRTTPAVLNPPSGYGITWGYTMELQTFVDLLPNFPAV